MIPGLGGTQRLARRIGVPRARELIYRGALIDAEAALRLGFVNEVTAPEELMPRTRAVADRDRLARAAGRRGRQAGPAPGRRRGRWTAASRWSDTSSLALRDTGPKGGDARLSRQARARVDRNMNFELTPEQQLIRDTARDLATSEIAPQAAEIDRAHQFPRRIFSRLGELGLLGIMVPEQWGGAGMDTLSYALALEEISRACASTGVTMSVQSSLVEAPDPEERDRRAKDRAGCPIWPPAARSAASRCPSPRRGRTRRRRRRAPFATATAGS